MPSYGPEVLGPPPRDPEQQYWDPEIQTMDPEKLRGAPRAAPRQLVQKIFDNPVPLFPDKLAEAGIRSPEDIKSLDDLEHVPLTGEAGSARLRGRASSVG